MYGARLLLVEDDFDFRTVMAETLADEGFDVIEAESGDTAVEMLPRLVKLDILITDMQMPGDVDGNCLATEAKRHYPGLPVLYMSGYPSSLTNSIGPIDAFVRKPFSARCVLVEIGRLLAAVDPHGISYRFYCSNGTRLVGK